MGGAAGHMAHPFDCREVRNGKDLISFYVKAVNAIPLYDEETKGSSVSVKLDALPFQQYGDLDGQLAYISQDTYTQSLSGEEGSFYRGRVDIPAKELAGLPPGFRLTPGMLASADMKVGERYVITYLTHPIMKGFSSAFSEPD